MGNANLKSVIEKAFYFNCPSCEARVYPKWAGFKGWRLGLVYCKNCTTYMKLSNGLFLASLYGVFCGALFVSTRYWRFGSEWLRIIVLIAICGFVVWPIFMRLLGHWKIVTDLSKLKQLSPKAKMWRRYASLSFWLSAASMFSVSLVWWFYLKRLEHDISVLDEVGESIETQLLVDNAVNSSQSVISTSVICFALGIVFFLIGIICHRKMSKNNK
jgi:hypothetical protein